MDGTVACRLVFLPEIVSDSRFHVKAYVPVEIVADSGCGAYRELYALDAAEGRFPTAVARIGESTIDELVVTDTIPLTDEAQKCKKIRQLSVADVLAETIRRISNEDSVSSLFIE